MTTIVNTPSGDANRGGNTGMMVALLLILFVVLLLFFYGRPLLNQVTTPSIQVPEEVDVNVNTPNQQ